MKKIITSIALIAAFNSAQGQTVTGGDMETWKNYTSVFVPLTRPDGWTTSDSLFRILKLASGGTFTGRVTQSSTVKHGGASSAMLVSDTDSLPAIMTNATIEVDLASEEFTYSGGTNVSKRIQYVNTWAQYASAKSADTGAMLVEAYKNGIGAGGADSLIGSAELDIVSNTAFTKLIAEINYVNPTIVPDRIVIAFITSVLDYPAAGTTLYIDDVTLTDPTGIETPLINDRNIRVYPNPAVNRLMISTEISEPVIVTVYTASGQSVIVETINKKAEISVTGLVPGNYTYVLTGENSGHKYYSAIFTKQQ